MSSELRPVRKSLPTEAAVRAGRGGKRRTLRRRHVQNWLWISGLAVAAGFACRIAAPSESQHAVSAPAQVAGVLLLAAGLWIRILARGWKHESPGRRLVVDGLYGYVRNPLYAGSFLIGLALCVLLQSVPLFALYAVSFSLVHWRVVRREESALERRWGDLYRRYREAVPALIPAWSAIRARRPLRPRSLFHSLCKEADALCLWPAVAGIVLVIGPAPMLRRISSEQLQMSVLIAAAAVAAWLRLRRGSERLRGTAGLEGGASSGRGSGVAPRID